MLAALLLTAEFPASAAEIEIKGSAIYLSGEIEPGDELRFAGSIALQPDGTTVFLKSEGGWLNPSLNIGRLIRKRGFATRAVEVCTASCALIWLAGEPRSLNTDAKVGFHNTSYEQDGKPGPAQRIQEDYLSDLGLRKRVIRFATSNARSNINFLTRKDARRLHLQVQFH
jgi:hypothetical protein